jgi:hypothetical protein
LVLAGTICVLGLVLYLPSLRQLFSFAVLHFDDLLICFGVGIASIMWFEMFKLLIRHTSSAKRSNPSTQKNSSIQSVHKP